MAWSNQMDLSLAKQEVQITLIIILLFPGKRFVVACGVVCELALVFEFAIILNYCIK